MAKIPQPLHKKSMEVEFARLKELDRCAIQSDISLDGPASPGPFSSRPVDKRMDKERIRLGLEAASTIVVFGSMGFRHLSNNIPSRGRAQDRMLCTYRLPRRMSDPAGGRCTSGPLIVVSCKLLLLPETSRLLPSSVYSYPRQRFRALTRSVRGVRFERGRYPSQRPGRPKTRSQL